MTKLTKAAFITLLVLLLPLPLLAQDADLDGMPDTYEIGFPCLMPFVPDGDVDYDADGLQSLAEFTYSPSLDPCAADTDGDNLTDGAEVSGGSNPLDPAITPGLAKVWPEVQVTSSASSTWGGNLIFTGSEYGLFWQDGYTIRFNRLDLDGNKLMADQVVSPPTTNHYELNRDGIVWTGSEYALLMLEMGEFGYSTRFLRVSEGGVRLSDGETMSGDYHAGLVWTGSEFGLIENCILHRIGLDGQGLGETSLNPPLWDCILDWTGSEYGILGIDPSSDLDFQRVGADGDTLGPLGPIGNFDTFIPKIVWTGDDHRLLLDQAGTISVTTISLTGGDSITPYGFDVDVTPVSFQLPYLNYISWENNSFVTSVLNPYDYPSLDQIVTLSRAGDFGTQARLREIAWVLDANGMMLMTMPNLEWTGSEYGAIFNQPLNRHYSSEDHFPLFFARLAPDGDGDGLTDADEVSVFLTNPADWDTDGDQIPDGYEATESPCLDPLLAADGVSDGDTDGLTARAEYQARLDECYDDTDMAGEEDGHELAGGRDPLRPFDDLITTSVGAGAQDWAWPLHTANHDARTQTIYLASDVGRAGEIASIGLYVTIPPGQALTNFLVRMRPTTLAAYPTQNPAWESAGWVTCASGTTVITTSGWHDFACADRLYQSPTLINTGFMVDWSFDNSTASADGTVRYFSPGGKRSLHLGANSTLGAPTAWAGASPAGTTSGRAPILQLLVEADDDNDGMIDNWEKSWRYNGIDVDCFGPYSGNTAAHPPDMDGDGLLNYDEIRTYGTSPCRADTDGDGTNDGADCAPLDRYNWISCATCADLDGDGWKAGCDSYPYNQTADCNDLNPNAWNTCATCIDGDGDNWFGNCNVYAGINGPDCNDANINTWNTCSTCRDADHDGSYGGCNQYLTIPQDCNDSDWMTWNTCATCVDADNDDWHVGCNDFGGLKEWTVGTGSVDFPYPLGEMNYSSRSQSLYLASEISGGTISEISFNVTVLPGHPLQNFTIRMKHTTLNYFGMGLWQGPNSGWTTVYQGTETITATGWHAITLAIPFAYNGVDNLIVDFSTANSVLAANGVIASTIVPLRSLAAMSALPSPLTWTSNTPAPTFSSNLPNLRFKITRSPRGPDCNDNNTYVWNAANCPTCIDGDGDNAFRLCDRYLLPYSVVSGAGGSSSGRPLYTYYQDSRMQVIYLASEIGAAKTITAVALRVTTLPAAMNNFTIRMKHTSLSSFSTSTWDGPASGWTTVYQAYTVIDTTGWHTFNLSTPFVYNGSSNLMVDFSFDNSSSSTYGVVSATTRPSIRALSGGSASLNGDPLLWTGSVPSIVTDSSVPDLRFSWLAPGNYGPDCNDANPNTWNTCATCVDGDGDAWYGTCNAYAGINGPDCNDANRHAWDTCATCMDTDGDAWYGTCNNYTGINGPDCNDANARTWNTCATCADGDVDTWYGACNDYTGINGPDCSDSNSWAWTACATCIDADADSWYGLCDRYVIPGGIKSIGAGTGATNLPISTGFRYNRTQLIYLASEIGQAGTISTLALDVTTVPGMVMNNFTIRLKHTSLSSHSSIAWEGPGGWTTVYQANETPGVVGWHTFTFTTPFVYNGTGNLMVDISFSNASTAANGNTRYSSAGANRSIYYRSNTSSGDPLSWTGTSNPTPIGWSFISNLRLTFQSSINGPDCDDAVATGATCHNTCTPFYFDQDADTYGDPASSLTRCVAPAGYVADNTDCVPTIVTVHPGQPSPEGPGALCDGLDNNCLGDPGYGEIDEGCVPPDADGDGLSDGQEIIIGTDPNVADTDGDGLSDGEEYLTRGTDPLYWDTDGDALPDAFEVANLSGHTVGENLNPLVAEGNTADFDHDGNLNVHEYWNGSSPWAVEPVGAAGCFFWGDANGDGYIGPPDNAALTASLKGSAVDYSMVIPGTGETQDLNADTYYGPPDLALLAQFLKGSGIASMPSRPTGIEQLSSGPTSVKVGDTTHLTVGMRNSAGLFTPGFGVVFTIDPTSTGTATILGGDGADPTGFRYDVSGTNTLSPPSRIVIRVDSAGEIKINASTPLCGEVLNMGRYCDPLNMPAPFVITGHD